MNCKMLILCFSVLISFYDIPYNEKIQYIVDDCVINQFKISVNNVNENGVVDYFILYSTNSNYSLQLSQTELDNLTGKFVSTSGRYIQVGNVQVPLIFDYDLIFATSKTDPNRLGAKIIEIIRPKGLIITFSKGDHCQIISIKGE